MKTVTGNNTDEAIILQIIDLTKYYKCEDEEDNLASIINFLRRKEDLGIKDVSFDVYEGHVVGILGSKKCGKSTLLKLIAGIIKPSSGKILYKGARVTSGELREAVSYISKEQPNCHEYNCTLFENVIQYACRDDKQRCEVVDRSERLLRDFGMDKYRYKEVIKLPSSIRSKMFIARGFLSHKPVLCFDQPFSNIGEDYREVFINYIRDAVKSGKTIIMTSDEETYVYDICNEIVHL